MKKIFFVSFFAIFAVLFSFSEENSVASHEYVPVNIGVFGHRQYPFGDYGKHVYFEEGLGLMGDYALPFLLANHEFGVAAHLLSGRILSGNTALENSSLISFYGGAWLDFPLKFDISFRPELDFGFTTRTETIREEEKSYTDSLFQVVGSFRWQPKSLFEDELSFEFAPYFSLVPFEDNTTIFFGMRLGVVYNFGKMIHTIKVRRAEQGIQEIRDTLKNLSVSDVSIQRNSDGLTLIMDNIQFAANSAELLESEKAKLDALKPLFEEHKNNLLIAGYCADDGSAENNMHISAARAGAVADYLIQKGVRTASEVLVVGRGSLDSIDDNSTDSGRTKNRRVEITLLEK